MESLSWLHLSDFHFRDGDPFDRNIVLTELLKDIGEQIWREALQLDFIAVTGDIAFSGKPEEYKLAQAFFDELLDRTGVLKERLFVVPGNHDVDRSAVSTLARLSGEKLQSQSDVNAILASADDMQLMARRFKAYKAFLQEYGLVCLPEFDVLQLDWKYQFEKSGRVFQLSGLNTAWVCSSDEDDVKRVIIGERQVRDALLNEPTKNTSPLIRIALMHHPFDLLRAFDEEVSAALLLDNCNFILHGHFHRTSLNQLSSPDGGCMRIAGGSCYASREFPNTYNFVNLDFAGGVGQVMLRRFFSERGGQCGRGVVIYRNAPDGIWEFQMPADFYPPVPPPIASPSTSTEKSPRIPKVRSDEKITTQPRRESDSLQSLRDTLKVARRALAKLERRAAGYTSLTIPTDLEIELEDKRNEVSKLEGDWRVAEQFSDGSTSEQPHEKEISLIEYNRDAVAEVIHNAFSEQEITVLSFDHFSDIYSQFPGKNKAERADLLISYCFDNQQVQALLTLVQRYKPGWYSDYATRFWNPRSEPG